MTYTIERTHLTEEEYAAAFHYYESQQKGPGLKFEKETDVLMACITTNPYFFQRKYKHYREAVIKNSHILLCMKLQVNW
jgi:hypothetical protein